MIEITFEPAGRKLKTDPGHILEIARDAGVPIRSDGGGKGVCGKCKVEIVDAKAEFSKITEAERKHLSEEELKSGYRLACQTKILSGRAKILIPPESRLESRKIADLAVEREIKLNPPVRKVHAIISEPSLHDIRPDFERLEDVFGEFQIPLSILSELPSLLREANWDITAVFWKDTLISIEKGDTSNRGYGLAVDIGSSKIICHLVDLLSGETVARGYTENPQVAYGEDVVSRITYASKNKDHRKKLQEIVVTAINSVISNLCEEAGIGEEEIYEAVVVGNSVMHHLFFGINPKFIGVLPFVPAVRRGINYRAKEVGLKINPEGFVSSLPLIAGFVGADAVANIAVTGIHKSQEIAMLIDIGTNTEIVLGNKSRLLACSAPSGPAFEGAHISHGMKAVSGAIEKVRIVDDEVIYETVGNVKSKGICGTGMIDLVAELYRNGIISKNGKFIGNTARISDEEIRKYIVAYAEETEFEKPITVSEKDVKEFLMAKGAIKAGWTILAEKLGITVEKIQRIFLVGSFGREINIKNAKAIGLLPNIPDEKITFVGDTAVGGAKMALKSLGVRKEMEDVVKRIEYIELSAVKNFYSVFARSIPI